MKTKVAVLGGKGMLGSDLMAKLEASNKFEALCFDLPEFDITKADDIEKIIANTDIVINCAAYTNVDKAEDEPELAFAINTNALSLLGASALKHNVYVIHISTDFVFDGKLNRPYTEDDEPNPLNVYGKSKLAGELRLAESGCKHCIMRVEWSYGLNGTNFITKIIERAISINQPIRVVSDQIGSPTWTSDMAKAILFLLNERPQNAIFHFAAKGFASRFDVAKFVFEQMDKPEKVIPCSSSEFPQKAMRPLNSCFNTAKIQSILPYPIPDWKDSLDAFLKIGRK